MKIILLGLFFFYFTTLFSQTENSKNRYSKINWMTYKLNIQKTRLWKNTILPIVFGVTTISINQTPLNRNIQNTIRIPFNECRTSLDDYIQHPPIALRYSADAIKLKAEHSIWNQIKCLFISEVTAADIIQLLKHRLKIERPDQGPNNSFPSGHSGQDFVAAQVLHNEIKNTQPILAYNGYVFATSSGTLIIVNNKHWLPEVLRAARISMQITNILYHIEPLKN